MDCGDDGDDGEENEEEERKEERENGNEKDNVQKGEEPEGERSCMMTKGGGGVE